MPAPFSFVVGTEIKDPPGSEYYPEDIPCQALTHAIITGPSVENTGPASVRWGASVVSARESSDQCRAFLVSPSII